MKNSEKGQALILIVIVLGIVLIGAIGLAIDGAQIYAHREMAQAAADAAAQAEVMSIFAGTLKPSGATYTCPPTGAGPATSPACVYALNNGFGGTTADTVTVDFFTSLNGVTGSANYSYPIVRVTILRTLSTGFMALLGTTSSTVKAIGAAGIVQVNSALPIMVLHPTLSESLLIGPKGSAVLTITGGPDRAIQVNSNSATALLVAPSATIDLSTAGPSGTGADLGVVGQAAQPDSSELKLGTTGHYVQPAAPIKDPYLGLAAPTKPAAGTSTTIPDGKDGCNNSAGCTLFSPGSFSGNIVATNSSTYVFAPGLYYITSGNFGSSGAGSLIMCSSCASSPVTGSGMMVYLSGSGILEIGGSGSVALTGSDLSSTYEGLLIFSDHTAASQTHTISGAGTMIISGTIYLTNAANTSSSKYQTFSVTNSGGSSTLIRGEVIADAITMSGAATLTMQLSTSYRLPIDQIALVH